MLGFLGGSHSRRIRILSKHDAARSQGGVHQDILDRTIHRTHGGPGVVFFNLQLLVLF